MDLATARAIVADSSLAPTQADWMLAGRVLYDHWQRNPHLLKPARGGTLTTDAPRRSETLADTVADIRRLRRKLTRTLTRDQDNLEGAQQTNGGGVRSEPTVGGKRIMRLPGDASSYFIQSSGDGGCWVVEAGDLEGFNNGRTDIPSGTPTGDIARHRTATAARDRGAAFAAAFNANQRKHWGQ